MTALLKLRASGQVRAALFYFCFFGAGGVIGPFLYMTYRRHGLTPSQIGIVIAVAHVISFVVSPIWGGVSDLVRRRGRVPLLAIACVGAGPAILLVQTAQGLIPTLVAVVVWNLFAGGIVSLADIVTLRLLGDSPRSYGRVRVWGSVGGVLASLIAGKLGDLVGLDVIFPLYAGLLLACALIASRFPSGATDQPRALTGGLAALVRDRRVILFLGAVLFFGVGYLGWRSTFSMHLEDLGGDAGLIGVFFALSSLVEIPIMATSGNWLGVLGSRRALSMAFAVLSLMVLGCSFIISPGAAIPLAVVHGLSYAVFRVAGVVHMREISPPGYLGLAQGLYGGFSRGLGSIVGSLAGGFLFEQIGGPAVYRLSAQAGLVALVLLGSTKLSSVVRRRRKVPGCS